MTANYYDWRDRLVYTKQGMQSSENDGTHRPITYTTYDNLDEVTQTQPYDGDGVNMVTYSNGVPQPPAASLLRAETDTLYDYQGRVYRTQTYSVDTSGNRSAGALTTNNWYDLRGDLIETAPPGGQVTKTHYDAAGRPDVTYITDAGGDSSWSDAGNVAKDHVLSQTETTYDADGNAIFVVQRDRFNTDPAGTMTGLGVLGTPMSMNQPNARVSYVANYYYPGKQVAHQPDARARDCPRSRVGLV